MTANKKQKLDEVATSHKRNKRVSFGVVQVLGDAVAAGTQQIQDQVSFTTSSNTYPPEFKAPTEKTSKTTDIDLRHNDEQQRSNPFVEKHLNSSVDERACKITETVDCEESGAHMSFSSSITQGLASATVIEAVKRNKTIENVNITAPVTETVDINNSILYPRVEPITKQGAIIEDNIDKYEKALEALDFTKIESKGSKITQEQRNSLPVDYAKILRDYADEEVLQEEPCSVQTTQFSASFDNTTMSRDQSATKTNIHITNNIQNAPLKFSNIKELAGYISQKDFENVKMAIFEKLNRYKNSNLTTSEIIDKSIVSCSRKEVEQTNLIITNDIMCLLQNSLTSIKENTFDLKSKILSQTERSTSLKEAIKAREDSRLREMKDILVESYLKFRQAEHEISEKEKLLQSLYNKNITINKEVSERKEGLFQHKFDGVSSENKSMNKLETKELERLSFWMGIKDIGAIIDQIYEHSTPSSSLSLLNNLKQFIIQTWKRSLELKLIIIFKEVVYQKDSKTINLFAEIEDLENNNVVYINEYIVSNDLISENNLGGKEFGDNYEDRDGQIKLKLLE
eukprot:GAHX01001718.1.p1 GENE.GAHX01001718.1~~GAHX01001718.1.p1  ORF type:complete len:570 (-),score=130.38 GAHX01001718.1:3170-4879(-)